ncbi:hypothetical protein F5Y16DRAFT_393422 [Xylariaceae sp. FL0255]|nr:hypothetical protein F5Y16DRAFT_393422 [Xylariaceae sp. FL0255]
MFAHVTHAATQREYLEGGRERWSGSGHLRCFLNPVTLERDFTTPTVKGIGMEYCSDVKLDYPDTYNNKDLFVIPMLDIQDPILVKQSIYNSETRGLLLQLVDAATGAYA